MKDVTLSVSVEVAGNQNLAGLLDPKGPKCLTIG